MCSIDFTMGIFCLKIYAICLYLTKTDTFCVKKAQQKLTQNVPSIYWLRILHKRNTTDYPFYINLTSAGMNCINITLSMVIFPNNVLSFFITQLTSFLRYRRWQRWRRISTLSEVLPLFSIASRFGSAGEIINGETRTSHCEKEGQ